jgi:hypothetical protein
LTARRSYSTLRRTSVEAALRHLGAQRYGKLVELIEHAIRWPDGNAGTILAPLTEPTAVLHDWTASERAHALWKVIEEGVVHPQVGPTPQSRRRRALQAALRLPDKDIGDNWGASLTERFKQLRAVPGAFGDATSTQPMEIAWKRGVERLSEHLELQLKELTTPEDWACYRPVEPHDPRPREARIFRRPSEGAQKLFVNLLILTVLMRERGEYRRITERLITSRDDEGLKCYTTHAFSSQGLTQGRTYVPTHALWGCRAQQVVDNGLPVTQLCFPRPLKTGEQAHFVSEAVHELPIDGPPRGWANVVVDHHGIAPGELRDGLVPVSGLTIRIRFDRDSLPTAAWWYAEQNESERYIVPPLDSPYRLPIVRGDVVKTFNQPCQPRENYGIAYSWS